MFQLRTSRLLLRDITEEDIPLIRSLAQEPTVTRYQSWLKLDSEDAVRQWVRNAMFHNRQNPRGAYNLAIVEISRECRIGWIGWGSSEDPTHGEYSFGYALLPSYWGQGYMTEALRAGLAFIFEALGAQGITDYCETTNIGSMRVMQKVGLTEVARRQEESVEYVRYAIQKEAWTKQQVENSDAALSPLPEFLHRPSAREMLGHEDH